MKNSDFSTLEVGQTLADDVVKGLKARLNRTRSVSFLLKYRTRQGQQRMIKIGELGELTIAEARARAKAIKAQVAIGRDPKGDWDKAKQTDNSMLKLRDLFQRAMASHWNVPRYRNSGYLYDVTIAWKKNIEPFLGDIPLVEITQKTVRSWHKSLSHKPTTANRNLAIVSKLFSFAEQEELLPLGSNPCRYVTPFPEKSRSRYASHDELSRILPILKSEFDKHPNQVAFLLMLLYTGSRPSAIERATWRDVQIIHDAHGRYGVMRFYGKSSANTGGSEILVIPEQALQYLERLPRRQSQSLTSCKMPHKLWRKVRAKAGCPDLWARDFRRTFASVGLSSGIGIGTIGELLNHSSTQTTKVYAKLQTDARAAAATHIAKRISDITASIASHETSAITDNHNGMLSGSVEGPEGV